MALVATFENIGAEPLYLHQNQYQRLHLRLTRQRVQCHSQILERALKSRSVDSKSGGTVRLHVLELSVRHQEKPK